jgi:hypothetical protein
MNRREIMKLLAAASMVRPLTAAAPPRSTTGLFI